MLMPVTSVAQYSINIIAYNKVLKFALNRLYAKVIIVFKSPETQFFLKAITEIL